MKKIIAAIALLSLTGCMAESKDYDAAAYCQGQGMRPGESGYNDCIQQVQTGHMMDAQQREYDNMKQQQQDYRMQPYNGYGGR